MKISILQENLKFGLQSVGHLAGKNTNLPILSNILIEAIEGNVRFVSTNLEIGIISQVRSRVEKEGKIAVDAKIIMEYIGLLPNKKIEIFLKGDDLIVECENYKTKIKTQSAEEYPIIPSVEEEKKYNINKEDFKKAISQVIFAVASSEVKAELAGVCFIFNKNKLTLAATDSYRLAEKEIVINNLSKNKEDEDRIIVPANVLQEVVRLISNIKEDVENKNGDTVSVITSENQILFSIGNIQVISKLIEGQYPDYKQIIPTKPQTTALVNKIEFLRAVKAASLFSKTGVNDINLDLPQNKNQLIISSESGQSGESLINLKADVKGEDNGVVINFRYLLDGINSMEDENIKIEIVNNSSPCVLRGEKDAVGLYIIMPIKQ